MLCGLNSLWIGRWRLRVVQKGRRTGGAERCTLYGSNSLVTWEPGPSTEGRRRRRWKERQQWREKRKLIRCRNVRARGPEYGRTGTMVPSEERDSLLGGGAVPERRSITQAGFWAVFPSRTISKLHPRSTEWCEFLFYIVFWDSLENVSCRICGYLSKTISKEIARSTLTRVMRISILYRLSND